MSSIHQLEFLLDEQARRTSLSTPSPGVKLPAAPKILTLAQQMERDEDKTIEVRTGLSQEEFTRVLDLLMEEEQPVRRGRKLMDVDIRLVIFLQWLKFGQTYRQLGASFKISATQVQTAISDLWNPLIRILMANFIPNKPLNYVPTRSFDNFPQAVGALDATLIPVSRPLNPRKARKYLSGKHRKYGIRLQVLVAPDGHVIHYGGIIKGSRHDFILYQSSCLARDMLTMVVQADGTNIPTRRAILADGGYQGIISSYPEAIIPRRRKPHRQLSDGDRTFNTTLSHDRIVVERYFGRLKAYWGIIQKPVRLDKVNLDGLMRILVCLTNFKLENAPLYAEETIYNPDPECNEEEEWEEESNVSIPNTPTTQESQQRRQQMEGTRRVKNRKRAATTQISNKRRPT